MAIWWFIIYIFYCALHVNVVISSCSWNWIESVVPDGQCSNECENKKFGSAFGCADSNAGGIHPSGTYLGILTGDHAYSGTNSRVLFSYKLPSESEWSNWIYLDKCDHDDFISGCYWDHFIIANDLPFNELAQSMNGFKFEFAICGNDGLQITKLRFSGKDSEGNDFHYFANYFLDNPDCTWHSTNTHSFAIDGNGACQRAAFEFHLLDRFKYISDGNTVDPPCSNSLQCGDCIMNEVENIELPPIYSTLLRNTWFILTVMVIVMMIAMNICFTYSKFEQKTLKLTDDVSLNKMYENLLYIKF